MDYLNNYKYGFVNNYYVDMDYKYPRDYNYKYNDNILITDWLWGYRSINIIKLRPDITDNKYLLDTEYDSVSFIDYFYRDDIPKKNITHIIIRFIDRGIPDFIAFSNMLNELYPNLKILEFAQNYSYGNKLFHRTNPYIENITIDFGKIIIRKNHSFLIILTKNHLML